MYGKALEKRSEIVLQIEKGLRIEKEWFDPERVPNYAKKITNLFHYFFSYGGK